MIPCVSLIVYKRGLEIQICTGSDLSYQERVFFFQKLYKIDYNDLIKRFSIQVNMSDLVPLVNKRAINRYTVTTMTSGSTNAYHLRCNFHRQASNQYLQLISCLQMWSNEKLIFILFHTYVRCNYFIRMSLLSHMECHRLQQTN